MCFYVIRNSVSYNVKKPLLNSSGLLLAGLGGFEPPDAGVRIQCLTACQAFCYYNSKMHLQYLELLTKCRRPESNRYGRLVPQDFKSCASASSATPACDLRPQMWYHISFFIQLIHRQKSDCIKWDLQGSNL